MKRKKIAILHNIVSPHIIPCFELLSKEESLDVKVFFCSESEGNRIWKTEIGNKFSYAILPNRKIEFKGKDLFTYFINLSVISELKKFNPDIIISAGWDLFSYQTAFFYSKFAGKKYILWSGSTQYEPSWRRTLAFPLVKLMVKGSDAYLAYGTRAKEYLISLGAKPKKIFVAHNTTNVKFFSKEVNLWRKKKARVKKELGIKTSRVILYVGQLIERKGVNYLIEAFREIKREDNDTSLLIVGYGKLETKLRLYVKKERINDIIFAGGVEWEKTPKYYAVSDVLVTPSLEEVWGLVLNEAMSAGLPIVATDVAGSAPDLIKDGVNGFIVKPGSSEEISKALLKILTDKNLRKQMSRETGGLINNFTPQKAVSKIKEAIKYVNK